MWELPAYMRIPYFFGGLLIIAWEIWGHFIWVDCPSTVSCPSKSIQGMRMGKPTNANAITSGPSGRPLWASPLNAWPHLWSSFSIQNQRDGNAPLPYSSVLTCPVVPGSLGDSRPSIGSLALIIPDLCSTPSVKSSVLLTTLQTLSNVLSYSQNDTSRFYISW